MHASAACVCNPQSLCPAKIHSFALPVIRASMETEMQGGGIVLCGFTVLFQCVHFWSLSVCMALFHRGGYPMHNALTQPADR